MEFICSRGCGFRVHDRYFRDKPQYSPGICPRCNGPVSVVHDGQDSHVPGYHVLLRDEGNHSAGDIVAEATP